MKLTINKPVEVQAKWLKVYCGGRLDYAEFSMKNETYEDLEDFLKAYPQLKGDLGNYRDEQLMLVVDIDSGEVVNWPKNEPFDFYDWKVVDEGRYIVLDRENKVLADYEDYVPDCIGEGGWGDYFEFGIDKNGYIEDWKFTQEMFDELCGTKKRINI